MRKALNTLATVAPDWLRSWLPAEWVERYGRRFEEYRLPPGRPERYVLAEMIGADGLQLLSQMEQPTTPEWLRQLGPVETLWQVWVQQFYASEAGCI